MTFDFSGRVAFITGATGGIGRAVAERFLNAGATVIGTGRRPVEIDHPGLTALKLDVCDEEAVKAAVAEAARRHGTIDYLIHMAGMVGKGRLDEMPLADWHQVMDTNLTSAFLLMRESYPHLSKPGGVAVLCGSTNGLNGGSYLSGAAYACSKAALINLTRYCAKEWAPDGIRTACISPGPVDTPMLDRLSEDQHQGLKDALPLGRYATSEECASAVAYLCSDAAASQTGVNLNISSGLVLD